MPLITELDLKQIRTASGVMLREQGGLWAAHVILIPMTLIPTIGYVAADSQLTASRMVVVLATHNLSIVILYFIAVRIVLFLGIVPDELRKSATNAFGLRVLVEYGAVYSAGLALLFYFSSWSEPMSRQHFLSPAVCFFLVFPATFFICAGLLSAFAKQHN